MVQRGRRLSACQCTGIEGMIMITTLTLNPAFDVHVSVKDFRLGRETFAESVIRDVGGKGINISRALLENNIENIAVVVLGSENSADFTYGMDEVGIKYKSVLCNGRIRENITIHPEVGDETRLSFKGFKCDASLLSRVENLIDKKGVVTFTGSVPEGVETCQVEDFLMNLRESGVKLVIDSKSVTLDMLRRIKPWLIKPNAEEINTYCGKEMSEKELYNTARELNQDGIENVMISLGENGAILAAEGTLYRACVPKINSLSTIGAGDSTIAGFIACEGTTEERLRTAVSYGSAACLLEGTNPPLTEDIKKIFDNVKIQRIKL